MIHLGGKVGGKAFKFFVWNTAASFLEEFPNWLTGFLCLGRSRDLVSVGRIVMLQAFTLLQLLQCCGNSGQQGRERLPGLVRQGGKHTFLFRCEFKGCWFHSYTISRKSLR